MPCMQHLTGNVPQVCGVYCLMRYTLPMLLVLSSTAWTAKAAQYLPSIQQRWDASDFVCIGDASSPGRTGLTRTIDGSERDQLSAEVELETCFKGDRPTASEIRVLGYDVVAMKNVGQGYGYSGPPTGFVSKGRNLLFLQRTQNPDDFAVTVPIYETAIHLADARPDNSSGRARQSAHLVLTQELGAAVAQFGDTDLRYIDYLFDLLGTTAGVAELSRFSRGVPLAVQRDVAVALLFRSQAAAEPVAISLLLDTSAPTWKRGNAAGALGEHGTEAALGPLQQIALQDAATDDLESLRLTAQSSLDRLEHRLQAAQADTPAPR
jgi:hypothetical protein